MAHPGNKDVVLRLSGKTMGLAAGVLLVLALGRRLWSEALTLVTSYPAPSGIYNQIITTGNSGAAPADTTLNRNAGNTILVPPTNAVGKVGIGTTTPTKKLDVAGDIQATLGRFARSVQVGDEPAACNAAKTGALRWHGGAFEGCDGSTWKTLGGTGSSDVVILSGNNPTCASGFSMLSKKWVEKTCPATAYAAPKCGAITIPCAGCTTSSWAPSAPSCWTEGIVSAPPQVRCGNNRLIMPTKCWPGGPDHNASFDALCMANSWSQVLCLKD